MTTTDKTEHELDRIARELGCRVEHDSYFSVEVDDFGDEDGRLITDVRFLSLQTQIGPVSEAKDVLLQKLRSIVGPADAISKERLIKAMGKKAFKGGGAQAASCASMEANRREAQGWRDAIEFVKNFKDESK